uniref:Uncharacterized protein n=1 Tax=Arundo donax TaxID=35708 RepID=A0A0A9EQB2_ARUDO
MSGPISPQNYLSHHTHTQIEPSWPNSLRDSGAQTAAENRILQPSACPSPASDSIRAFSPTGANRGSTRSLEPRNTSSRRRDREGGIGEGGGGFASSSKS